MNKRNFISLIVWFLISSIPISNMAQNCKYRIQVLYKSNGHPVSEANLNLKALSDGQITKKKTDLHGILQIDFIQVNEKYEVSANKIDAEGKRYLSRPKIIFCQNSHEDHGTTILYLESLSSASRTELPPNSGSVSSSNGRIDHEPLGSGGAMPGSSRPSSLESQGSGAVRPGQTASRSNTPKVVIKATSPVPKKTEDVLHTALPSREKTNLSSNEAASDKSEKDAANLVEGRFAYDVPNEMKVGNSYQATVSITKSMEDEILFDKLDPSKFKSETIKLTSKVRVVLIDPNNNANFTIQSLNTEEQYVDINSNTIWKWNIIPLTSGEHPLILRATVKLISDMGETTKDIEIFQKRISVEASPLLSIKNFVEKYWQWLFGTFLIPLSLYFYKSRKNTDPKA